MEEGQRIDKTHRLCLGLIIAILFARFFKTIVLNMPISKLFLTSWWDSLFYYLNAEHSFGLDPSLIELHLPYRFFVADFWHHAVPLWNEYSGFGTPLLADPQAFVLSPIFALFFVFPNTYIWNITLILELGLAAIGTYLLCLELRLSFVVSLAAALLFTFCPYVQWQLELVGNGICLTPIVFLFFVKAGKQMTPRASAIAGIVAAVDILSAHPEMAFVSITFATLLMFFTAFYEHRTKFTIISVLSQIAIAAIVTFGLCAPLLIPFVEYLFNAQSYKFGPTFLSGVSPEALFLEYFFPYDTKGSLYFGPLAWWGLPIAFISIRKIFSRHRALVICSVLSVFTLTQVFPASLLFKFPPFSAVLAAYFIPEYLLFISILSSLGIAYMFTSLSIHKTEQWKIVLLGLTPLLVPIITRIAHHHFSNIVYNAGADAPCFSWRFWLLNCFSVILMLCVWRTTLTNPVKWKSIGLAAFLTIGMFNLLAVSVPSLPTHPRFHYPSTLPLKIETNKDARFITISRDIFRPDINLVYHLHMAQFENAMYPKGFVTYLEAAGAQTDPYIQIFPKKINRLIDLASVQTILSTIPPVGADKLQRFTPINHYGTIFTYNNKTALPRYFFARYPVWVDRNEDALTYIQAHTNELGQFAVIQNDQRELFNRAFRTVDATTAAGSSQNFDNSGHIKRLDDSQYVSYFNTSSALSLETNSAKPALLVISDLYYPGWKAFLDESDRPIPIFKANYLFRAVLVPAGSHHILFEYHPLSFAFGIFCFAITVGGLLFSYFVSRYLRRRLKGTHSARNSQSDLIIRGTMESKSHLFL